MTYDSLIEDIKTELLNNTEKWGDEFDDRNTLNDWVAYISNYTGDLFKAHKFKNTELNKKEARKALKKIVCVSIACIAALDRNDGFSPRHYD